MIELLAPGGSIAGIKASLNAGADAVYTGGPLFGARAYADNPDMDELMDILDYCHLRGKKVYLTVNTLLKEAELKTRLYDYLRPFYEQGLDAVLVQDLGVLRFIRQEFPDLPVHASTQMSIAGVQGAKCMKDLGLTRIVPARELSLKEIRAIRDNVDIEIECFIHGALCYCYSGRCLMSSIIGGRSGNRGRCAQPCRLPYSVSGEHHEKTDSLYALSLKDICVLHLLPELIESGICSFKIEGRMKRAEYAAGVSAVYRKYISLYEREGKAGYRVETEDERMLMDLYNRGGFSEGYYKGEKGRFMMALARPNHAGTPAAKVTGAGKGSLAVKALEDLHPGDVLELRPGEDRREYTLNAGVRQGQSFTLRTPERLKSGSVIPRVKSEELLNALHRAYCETDSLPEVALSVTFKENTPVRFSASGFGGGTASAVGDAPQKAQKAPLRREDLEKTMRKTGGSGVKTGEISISMDEGLFMPVSALNKLRRDAVEALQQDVKQSFRRTAPDRSSTDEESVSTADAAVVSEAGERKKTAGERRPAFQVSIADQTQLEAAIAGFREDGTCLHSVLLDSVMFLDETLISAEKAKQSILGCRDRIRSAGIAAGLLLPPVWRYEIRKRFFELFTDDLLSGFDFFAATNADQTADFARFAKPMQSESSLYCWNSLAKEQLRELGFSRFVLPAEETGSEMISRGVAADDILTVYGYLPLMITSPCVQKNLFGCTHKPGLLRLKDRTGRELPVENRCGICTNIIYNALPTDLSKFSRQAGALKAGLLRVSFTLERPEQVSAVLSHTLSAFCGNGDDIEFGPVTAGHFRKGVE